MIDYISGEFLLKSRPNGGTVVLLRTFLISVTVYLLVIGIKSRLEPGAAWALDLVVARKLAADTIPWFGAIFAGVYAALYTRFASQWNYLSNLYNEIMSTLAQNSHNGSDNSEAMAVWKASFIEDAEDLHLALKPMFASVIEKLLDDQAVRVAYISNAPGGAERLKKLETGVRAVNHRAVSSSKCNRLRWIRPEGNKIKSAFWKEKLCGAFPAKGFSGADIQGPGDGIEIILRVDA